MTLRELIEHCTSEGFFDDISTHMLSLREEWTDTAKVTKQYRRIADELSDLPGDSELADHVILIRRDEHRSVLLGHEESVWSLDFVDWNSLVDLPIKDEVCKTLTERLARVLYEITFWGMTRESVLQQAEETRQASEGKLIEVTVEEFLQELDQYK
jgi:hypothetical protein